MSAQYPCHCAIWEFQGAEYQHPQGAHRQGQSSGPTLSRLNCVYSSSAVRAGDSSLKRVQEVLFRQPLPKAFCEMKCVLSLFRGSGQAIICASHEDTDCFDLLTKSVSEVLLKSCIVESGANILTGWDDRDWGKWSLIEAESETKQNKTKIPFCE